MDVTHGIRRYAVRQGALVLRNSSRTCRSACTYVVDPQVGSERRAVALLTGDGRILVGPDNGPSASPGRAAEGCRSRWTSPLAASTRARVGHLPRTRHLLPWLPISPYRPTPATRSTRPRSHGRPPEPAAGRRGARGARARGRPVRERGPRRGPRGPSPDRDHARRHGRDRGRGRALPRHVRPDLRRRAARRADRLRGRLPHPGRGDQSRRRRHTAPRAGLRCVRLRPR